jgi:hypothetical protein
MVRPVQLPRSVYAVVDQQKVWLGGDSLYQLSIPEIKAAATNCGRMMTTDEYRIRQRHEIEKTAIAITLPILAGHRQRGLRMLSSWWLARARRSTSSDRGRMVVAVNQSDSEL